MCKIDNHTLEALSYILFINMELNQYRVWYEPLKLDGTIEVGSIQS
ncbi:hypothetical protein ACSVDA_00960 [Cytobacillus sp. Hm23]